MDDTLIKILLLEDDLDEAEILTSNLSSAERVRFEVTTVQRLGDAIDQLQQTQFDIVLTDLNVLDSSGLDTFTMLHAQVPNIPIIVMTGMADEELALQAVGAGAQDFLVKGHYSTDLIVRSIRYAMERNRMSTLLVEQSLRDQLTGLYNRRGFFALAEQTLKVAERNKQDVFFYFIDVDGLKKINDEFGHEQGDRTLIEVAEILHESFRASDLIARFGGDEFVALAITNSGTQDQIIPARLFTKLEEHNARQNRTCHISFSIGETRINTQTTVSVDDLVREADREMYAQKGKKRQNPK